MITLKEQAVKILQGVPEEKLPYVVDILIWLTSTFEKMNNPHNNIKDATPETSSDTLKEWNAFRKYKGIINYEIDERAELAKARDEKYEENIMYAIKAIYDGTNFKLMQLFPLPSGSAFHYILPTNRA